MLYKVSGIVNGRKITEYESPEGDYRERGSVKGTSKITGKVIEAATPEQAINLAIGQEAFIHGWDDWEWDQSLEVTELPPDQVMLLNGAPTLFDLSVL